MPFILLFVALFLLLLRTGKDHLGRPFVKNPLVPQMVIGYTAKLIKGAFLLAMVAGVMFFFTFRHLLDTGGSEAPSGTSRGVTGMDLPEVCKPDPRSDACDAALNAAFTVEHPDSAVQLAPSTAAGSQPPCLEFYCCTPGTRWCKP